MSKAEKSVLLVEDEDNIALALEFLIARRGFDLRRVANYPEAVAALEEQQPDLVVLDVMLPQGSGYDLCQLIREDESMTDTKVLMMSAAGEMAKRKGLALGADAFYVKPFDTKMLTDEICTLLEEPAHD